MQCGNKGDAIGVGRHGLARQFTGGGREIPKRSHVVRLAAGGDSTRRPGNERYTNAAFVQVSFATTQRTVRIKVVCVSPTFEVRSIVTGEKYIGRIVDPVFDQLAQDFSDRMIKVLHHANESRFGMSLGALVFAFGEGRFFKPIQMLVAKLCRGCQIGVRLLK